MRDLQIKFIDGSVKPLLELTDDQFRLVLFYQAWGALTITDESNNIYGSCLRIDIEKIIRKINDWR